MTVETSTDTEDISFQVVVPREPIPASTRGKLIDFARRWPYRTAAVAAAALLLLPVALLITAVVGPALPVVLFLVAMWVVPRWAQQSRWKARRAPRCLHPRPGR